MHNYIVLFVAVLSFVSCDAKNETTDAPKNKPKPPVLISAKKFEVIKKDKIEKRFQSWLKSQNDGDFTAYEKNYADKFLGIKRVGPRMSKYERAGWLKDRQRMFSKPVVVKADNLKIKTFAKTAVATFTQTWSSGAFKDVGTKQLVMIENGDDLKISREEMLDSKVLGSKTQGKYNALNGALITEGNYVVLGFNTASNEVKNAKIDDYYQVATWDTDNKGVGPLAASTWVVYDENGKKCEESGKFRMLSHAITYADQVEYWKKEKPAPAAIAREIANLAGPKSTYGVTELTQCKKGIWAHPKTTKPTLFNPIELGEEDQADVDRAWAKLPGHLSIQKAFESEEKSTDAWWTKTDLDRRAFSDGNRVFATITSWVGDGCGEFTANFWAVWEIVDGKPKLLTDGTNPGESITPTLAADISGDGIPAFFAWETMAQFDNGKFRRTHSVDAPNFGCRC